MPAPPPPPRPDSVYVPRAKARSSTLSAKSQYQADKEKRTKKYADVDGRRIYGDARGWRARQRTVSGIVFGQRFRAVMHYGSVGEEEVGRESAARGLSDCQQNLQRTRKTKPKNLNLDLNNTSPSTPSPTCS